MRCLRDLRPAPGLVGEAASQISTFSRIMKNKDISRRKFIGTGALGLGAVAGTAVAGHRSVLAASAVNPFAYDLERYAKTDPKLIKYELEKRFACGMADPRRIVMGLGDRLYVAGRSGISVLSTDGTAIETISTSGVARCVAVDAEGTLYAGLKDRIEVFDAKRRRVGVWEGLGKKTWFSGLAVGEKDLFAADSGNRVVLRYDRSGKLAGRIGEKNRDNNIPGLIVPSPYLDVVLAHDGLLRVNNTGRHSVEAYTVDGDLELSWGKYSSAIEGFCGCCNPIAITMLPDGRCITCEKGLPRVKIYSAEGAFECVVAGTETFPENTKGMAQNLADCMLGGLGAAVDSRGRVYILDLVSRDVLVMKSKV